MRIHHLTMTGIGPYAGTETIDFDAFSDSGRFLLTGPTGSGKSTVIDAIVFALYGDVADTSDSSRQRIRSTLLPPQAGSAVELVISTTAGVYRIRRTPGYERPKKRGQGTTTEHGTVRLWRLAHPQGQPVEEPVTRVGEADAEIRRVVGLSREQLTQTVVLPQGKFARFLRADSSQRQELLQDVFGTGVYDSLQSHLAEASRAGTRAVEEAATALRAQGRTLALGLEPLLSTPQAPQPTQGSADQGSAQGPAEASTAGTCPAAAPTTGEAAPEPPAAHAAWAGALAEELEAALAAAEPDPEALCHVTARLRTLSLQVVDLAASTAQTAQEELQQAQHRYEEARSLHERLERRRALLADQQALDERADQDAEAARHLEDAARADRVVAVLRSTEAARARASTAVSALEEAGAQPGTGQAPSPGKAVEAVEEIPAGAVEEAGGETLDALLEPVRREARRRLRALSTSAPASTGTGPEETALSTRAVDRRAHRLRQEHGHLEALAAQEADLTARELDLQERCHDLARQERELTDQAKALAGHPEQRSALVEDLEATRDARSRLTELEHRYSLCQEQYQAVSDLPRLEARLDHHNQALATASQAALQAAARVQDTRVRWIASAAGALAAELRQDTPCPVCGSLDHPDPAPGADQGTTREQVEEAEAYQDQADSNLVEARQLVRTCQDRLEETRQATAGLSLQEAQTRLEEARQALEEARVLAGQAQVAASRLADFDAASQRLRSEHDRARTALTASRSRLEADRSQLEQDRSSYEQARGSWPSVAARAAAVLAQAEAAETASLTVRQAQAALETAAQAGEELVEALEEEGFTTTQEVRLALLDPGARQALATRVRDAHAQRERVRAGLADPQVATLTGAEEADPQEAGRLLRLAQARHQEAADHHARRQEARAHLERGCQGVESAARAYQEALRHHAPLRQVARLARGDNPQATPLATWVLQTRFEEVLVFANERLAQMSSGRYELVRVAEETGSRSRRRGLGLAVTDHLAGEHRRDPRTLSGGETFYVSLALALALADVVAAESGGTTLDTLFIDEGFGSLDPETLQAVMAQVERLRAGGRTVGIVSHVEELRHQVADQVQVRRSPSGGSTLRVVR
ncbi:SMC family ATPase [Actinomyces sp. 2119]|uniref:AAA family ATPase n=1 Tax=Actinomyces sp. 2119 TaxID=2321393 RepID=UPI000E6C89FC|nr:SMC family ATPase [Actinomyces sp. 2119]RJF43279.1 SMC family ATPase [Actinomyces sp. 2119]